MSNDSEKQPPTAAEYESTIRSLHRAVRQAKREAEATIDNHDEIVERLEATHRCVVEGLRAEIVRLKDAGRFDDEVMAAILASAGYTGPTAAADFFKAAEMDLADLGEVRRQVAEDIDIAEGESVSAALKRSRALAAEKISLLIEREAKLTADRDAGWREAEQLRERIDRLRSEWESERMAAAFEARDKASEALALVKAAEKDRDHEAYLRICMAAVLAGAPGWDGSMEPDVRDACAEAVALRRIYEEGLKLLTEEERTTPGDGHNSQTVVVAERMAAKIRVARYSEVYHLFIRQVSKALQHDEDAPVPSTAEIVAKVERLKREHTEMVSERAIEGDPRRHVNIEVGQIHRAPAFKFTGEATVAEVEYLMQSALRREP